MGRDTAIDMRDFTEPIDYCVEVDWPGRNSFSTGYRRPAFGRTAPWVGSLIYHGRDPSGQMYRRNRFYDPQTGRFTQEDPIGIAGGLNVYGYAEGDPVSYSDPYGLCTIPMSSCVERERFRATVIDVGLRAARVVGEASGISGAMRFFSGRDLETNEPLSGGERAFEGVLVGASLVPGSNVEVTAGRAALSRLMRGSFSRMAGAGTRTTFRAAANLPGNAADWAYTTSREVWEHGGYRWQAHWAQNVVTGETALAKVKAIGRIE